MVVRFRPNICRLRSSLYHAGNMPLVGKDWGRLTTSTLNLTSISIEMDVVKAVRNYVEKMVESVSGLKVLLLDEETVGSMSIAFDVVVYILNRQKY